MDAHQNVGWDGATNHPMVSGANWDEHHGGAITLQHQEKSCFSRWLLHAASKNLWGQRWGILQVGVHAIYPRVCKLIHNHHASPPVWQIARGVLAFPWIRMVRMIILVWGFPILVRNLYQDRGIRIATHRFLYYFFVRMAAVSSGWWHFCRTAARLIRMIFDYHPNPQWRPFCHPINNLGFGSRPWINFL